MVGPLYPPDLPHDVPEAICSSKHVAGLELRTSRGIGHLDDHGNMVDSDDQWEIMIHDMVDSDNCLYCMQKGKLQINLGK